MSEIVIRHAETRDYEAIRQIHAQLGGVLQHTTGASSFRSDVAGATRRSSRHQATRRLY